MNIDPRDMKLASTWIETWGGERQKAITDKDLKTELQIDAWLHGAKTLCLALGLFSLVKQIDAVRKHKVPPLSKK